MTDTRTTAFAHDFTATDSEGRTIRLSDFKGTKHIVLVFNRGFS